MREVEKLKSFLDTMTYEEKKFSYGDLARGQYPFITISRETGAGGHTIASAILDEMGKEEGLLSRKWQVYDQELYKMVSEEPGMRVSLQRLLASEYRSQIEDMLGQWIVQESPQDVVLKKMFHIMRRLALYGKVVLVGHGGACLTRDLPLGVHIRLVASLANRVKRMMKLLKLDEKRAREVVLEQDHARAKLIQTYFNRRIDDPLIYGMVCNTDTLRVEEIARAVIMLVKDKISQRSHAAMESRG